MQALYQPRSDELGHCTRLKQIIQVHTGCTRGNQSILFRKSNQKRNKKITSLANLKNIKRNRDSSRQNKTEISDAILNTVTMGMPFQQGKAKINVGTTEEYTPTILLQD